jgi:hypothetical protein
VRSLYFEGVWKGTLVGEGETTYQVLRSPGDDHDAMMAEGYQRNWKAFEVRTGGGIHLYPKARVSYPLMNVQVFNLRRNDVSQWTAKVLYDRSKAINRSSWAISSCSIRAATLSDRTRTYQPFPDSDMRVGPVFSSHSGYLLGSLLFASDLIDKLALLRA